MLGVSCIFVQPERKAGDQRNRFWQFQRLRNIVLNIPLAKRNKRTDNLGSDKLLRSNWLACMFCNMLIARCNCACCWKPVRTAETLDI